MTQIIETNIIKSNDQTLVKGNTHIIEGGCEYNEQALSWLKKYEVTLLIELLNEGKQPWSNGLYCYHYRITMYHSDIDKLIMTFDFYGSHDDYRKGIQSITAYDVLTCLEPYAEVDTFEEFCEAYGYDELPLSEYPRVHDSYEELKRQCRCLESNFDSDALEELSEVA